jgi:mannose-6-phosphate isomerase-like protein (cupin superfamily)
MIQVLVLAAAVARAGEAPNPTPVVHAASAPAYMIAGGKGVATLLHNAATGSSEAAIDLLSFQDGAAVPPHVHAESAEFLYVLEGRAEMTIAGQVVVIQKGDALRVPAGVEHSAKVIGSLQAVQVYVGPGPEQRFAQGTPVTR